MRRKARPGGGRQAEVTIDSVGGRGDGTARLGRAFGERPVFVPMTLPGDRVRLRLTGERAGGYTAEVIELIEAGPAHAEPPCPHFGPCGGCALQHWQEAAYRAWKAELLPQALARRGLAAAAIRPLACIAPGTRRRVSLAAERRGRELRLGFHGRGSHALAGIAHCLLLTPALNGLLAPLRAVLAELLPERGGARVTLCESDEGIDLLLESAPGREGEPDLAARVALAAFAAEADLARLSWAPPGGEAEPLALRRPPRFHFGGVPVVPPPGGFVQPTAAGEAFLTAAVLEFLGGGEGQVADLFAGCGTFTFPVAVRGRAVRAVEGEAAALAALEAAARQAGMTRVTADSRDLERQPLLAAELDGLAAVVFDPPRAGARAQAAEIAASKVPTAIAVSCNPRTFARDARILVDGGFDLIEARPLDQFPWSGHLELVALFRR